MQCGLYSFLSTPALLQAIISIQITLEWNFQNLPTYISKYIYICIYIHMHMYIATHTYIYILAAYNWIKLHHYSYIIIVTSQEHHDISNHGNLTVFSTACSGQYHRNHQSYYHHCPFVRGIHWWRPIMCKEFPWYDVIMTLSVKVVGRLLGTGERWLWSQWALKKRGGV